MKTQNNKLTNNTIEIKSDFLIDEIKKEFNKELSRIGRSLIIFQYDDINIIKENKFQIIIEITKMKQLIKLNSTVFFETELFNNHSKFTIPKKTFSIENEKNSENNKQFYIAIFYNSENAKYTNLITQMVSISEEKWIEQNNKLKQINSEEFVNNKINNPNIIDWTNEDIFKIGFQKKIEDFKNKLSEIIKQQKGDEKELQDLFFEKENRWIFKFLVPRFFNMNNILKEFKFNNESIIDFLILGQENNYLIEFKNSKPLPINKKPYRERGKSSNIYGINNDLIAAINQMLEYSVQAISDFSNINKVNELKMNNADFNKLNFEITETKITNKIIVGWTKEIINLEEQNEECDKKNIEKIKKEQIQCFENFRNSINITIITYDEIIYFLEEIIK